MDRTAKLLSLSTRRSRILEVGAGYSPVAPKAEGWLTHVVDHADQATLRRKYASAAVDVNRIEAVDTIWRDGPLDAALPADTLGQFDTMIASHVLEHIPDLVGFLKSAERIMRADGVIAVALPDRRFCFDCLKPATTTGDLLEAHRAGRVRHGTRTVWNHLAYSVAVDGGLAWDASTKGTPRFLDEFATAASMTASLNDDPSSPYVDFHCSYFTPAGFRLAMLELGQIGMTNWAVTEISPTIGFEFFAFLRLGHVRPFAADRLRDERMALFREQLREQRVVIDWLCPPDGPVGPMQVDRVDGCAAVSDTNLADLDGRLVRLEHRLVAVETTLGRFLARLEPFRRIKRWVVPGG